MLQQILTHTPNYVWAILAFLVYRGVLASRDREVTLRNLFIMPVAMLVLSLQNIIGKFGGDAMLLIWAAGAAASAALTWNLIDAGRIGVNRAAGTVRQRGSWAPLALMLTIFVIKFSVSVLLVALPAAHDSALFSGLACLLFGLCNGVFIGRLLRYLSVYLMQPATANA